MFERFTEHARRTIFFARHEAASLSNPWIETEHLLLGIIREDRGFSGRLPSGAAETIRKQIDAKPLRSTSIDLPLSHESKRALALDAEEAEMFFHKWIDTGHLVFGFVACRGMHGIQVSARIRHRSQRLPIGGSGSDSRTSSSRSAFA